MAALGNTPSVGDWLKNYWFLLVAFFSISMAYGQATMKIQTLENAVKETSIVTKDVRELRSQVDKNDERTKALVESQVRQERMIEMLLQNQQQQLKSQKLIAATKN